MSLLQVQALPRAVYEDSMQEAVELVTDLDGFSKQDWADYASSIVGPSADRDRPFGQYAVAARKRRKGGCPFGAQSA